MTCRDFQSKWDELLDADVHASVAGAESSPMLDAPGASPSAEPGEEALLDHAAGCPDCRQLATRYRVLRQATRAWKQPPLPSADLVDRILAAAEVSTTSAWPVYADVGRERVWPIIVWMASVSAAACIALSFLTAILKREGDRRRANPPSIASLEPDHDLHAVSRSGRTPGDPRTLNRALAEATSATWDLARSASEPAARISREMLDATTRSEEILTVSPPEGLVVAEDRSGTEAVGVMVPVPSLARFAPDSSAASAALQQVGDHLAAGVRPLSATARHAFGFLIGPPPDQAAPRNRPPSAKGA